MNQVKARRALELGFAYVAHYDRQAHRVAAWVSTSVPPQGLTPWASDQAAQQALWGQTITGQAARQVTTNALAGVLTMVIPLPAGGFVVGVVERQLLQNEAQALADDLERVVRSEVGPTWAPMVTVGLAIALLIVVGLYLRREASIS